MIRKLMWMLILILAGYRALSQEIGNEFALETEAVQSEEDVEEDDGDALKLEMLMRSPINLNTAEHADLAMLPGISPLLIQSFMAYRERYGSLGSIYELQAVDGFTADLCRRWKPYIQIGAYSTEKGIVERMKHGKHSLLVRAGRDWNPTASTQQYLGGDEKLFLRYLYRNNRSLQWGIVAEKDAGEPLFRGASKLGFDFYSLHFFIRDYRKFKQIALGDFRVQWGQGLVLWQGPAYSEPGALTVLRQPAGLMPAQSAAEYQFMRGAGVTVKHKRIQITAFVSSRKADGNFLQDSLLGNHITSIQRSGYHRTPGEAADKGVVSLKMAGASATWQHSKFHVGVNGLVSKLNLPYLPGKDVYKRFTFRGDQLAQGSINYDGYLKGIYLFGETAYASTGGMATVNGMLFHPAPGAAISALYHNYGKRYAALEANAFGGSNPSNEKGGSIRAQIKLQQRMYLLLGADWYASHFFRYRTNGLARGQNYHAEWQAQLQRKCMLTFRLIYRSQLLNQTAEEVVHALDEKTRLSLRLHFQQSLSMFTTWSLRFEQVRAASVLTSPAWGSMFYIDISTRLKMLDQLRARISFTEVDSYDARAYAYVPGVAYAGRIAGFGNSGFHFNVMVRKHITPKCSFWANVNWMRAGTTVIGEEEAGNRLGVTLQAMYNF